MNVLSLMATLGLDSSEYNRELKEATKGASEFSNVFKKVAGGLSLAAAAKGIYDFGKQAVSAYSNYEQLVGGIDTLFKSSSVKVQAYAQQAYMTAGMSANAYMQTAIGFSSSLLNALGGDTEKAAEQTDRAIQDMSDNVNKMGTNMEMVQSAYRGFARGNYTMLDNLSLGFSGTKQGMEELLAKAEQLTGIHYDISSLSDIIDAIHEVQVSMGITGTTAKEAMETIEGASKAVSAAWQNVLTAIAGGGDLGQAVDGLITTLFGNGSGGLVPNLMTRITEVVKGVAQFIGKSAPLFIKELPKLLVEIGKSLATMLPELLTNVLQLIPNALSGLFDGIGELFGAGIDKASSQYQTVKKLIEAGLKGTVTLDADDGTAVLTKAKTIANTLQTDPEYKGTLVIDGDTSAADAALSNLQGAITTFLETGDITALQEAIAECEKLEIDPTLPPEKQKAVQEQLDALIKTLGDAAKLPIVMQATAGTVYKDVRGIISNIKNNYKGTLVIDGDTGAADSAIENLDSAVAAMTNEGGSVAELQAAIAECEKIEISPEYKDDKDVSGELAKLQDKLNSLKAQPITLTAEGKQALEDAKGIISQIEGQSGKLTIEGNTGSAQTAVDNLKKAISDMQNGEGSIATLQAAINECEELTVKPGIDEESKKALEEALAQIKTDLETASGSATFTYGYQKATDSDDAGWNTFVSFVNEHGWEGKEFLYTAKGEFKVDATTTEQIQAYAGAIASAASAITDYSEAASKITSVAEQKLKTDIENIDNQASEQMQYLGTLYNKGYITEPEYNESMTALIKDAEEQKRGLQAEYDKTVELAGVFTDGLKDNDYEAAAAAIADITKDTELSEGDYQSAIANLKEMGETGRSATRNDEISANMALDWLQGKASETKGMTEQAMDDYKNAIAEVEKMETGAEESRQMAELAEPLSDLAYLIAGNGDERFNTEQNSFDDVLQNVTQLVNEGYTTATGKEIDENAQGQLIDMIMGLLYDSEGNASGVDNSTVEAAAADVLAEIKASAQEQQEAADAARQEAEAALQEALQKASENNEMSSEEIAALIETIRKAGVDVDEETQAMIENVEQTAETAADQAASQAEGSIQKSLETIASMNEEVEAVSEKAAEAGDNVEREISSGTKRGASDMHAVLEAESTSVAGTVETKLDEAIGKERTLNVRLGVSGGGLFQALLDLNSNKHASGMFGGDIVRGMTPIGIGPGGTVHYAGESGAEAVVGVNSLDRMIQESVNSAIAGILVRMDSMQDRPISVNVTLDSRQLAYEIAPSMDNALGGMANWRKGGRA